jgi:Fe-Mn family superoxide dismutase
MTLQLPALPYALDALEPHMSQRTLEFHYGKHHKAYVDNTIAAVKGSALEQADLATIVRTAKAEGNKKLFNNSAQVWNHTFFWQGMKPGGGGTPGVEVSKLIERDMGGFDAFKKAFAAEATGHFASGWAWLVVKKGQMMVTSYHDADTPLVSSGVIPLLTIDVWEHAYYLDHQNARAAFVETFLKHLVNWDEVEQRLMGGAKA